MLELMPPFYFLTFAKVSVSVSKKFGLKKVLVSVSKTFGLKKRSRSRKFWSQKKVLVSVSMKFFGLVTQCLEENDFLLGHLRLFDIGTELLNINHFGGFIKDLHSSGT